MKFVEVAFSKKYFPITLVVHYLLNTALLIALFGAPQAHAHKPKLSFDCMHNNISCPVGYENSVYQPVQER